MIRQPFAAGRFYPGSAAEIREMMAVLVDKKARKEAAIGLLMPHAGYPYSGPVAGAAISRVRLGDTTIIIGPSHTGLGQPFSIMTEGSWQTPLGEVEIDSVLGKKLLASSSGYLREDATAHLYEHAVEVQVPFLQYLKPDIRIVPIILAYASAEVYKAIGRDIARAIKESDSKTVIIASGDMTHYEPQQVAEEKDKQAIEAMLKLDEDELTRRYEELEISMCAYGPAVCLITAAKELGATGAEMVRYQTSGDATGDYSSVVGYAGLIIRGGGG
jgi:AmmeMemoRadiSam system protein B